MQIRLIFRVVNTDVTAPLVGTDRFLTYVQRFDVIPQPYEGNMGPYPDPATKMFILKRAQRSDRTIMGNVVHLSQLRTPVNLIPRFGKKADPRLTKETALEYSSDFSLNKYFDKEMFYALDQ